MIFLSFCFSKSAIFILPSLFKFVCIITNLSLLYYILFLADFLSIPHDVKGYLYFDIRQKQTLVRILLL